MTETRFLILCYGGGLNRQTFTLSAKVRTLKKLGFTYENTDVRNGDHWIFVPVPSSRKVHDKILNDRAAGIPDPRLAEKRMPVRTQKRKAQ